jgi:hypothetical protein
VAGSPIPRESESAADAGGRNLSGGRARLLGLELNHDLLERFDLDATNSAWHLQVPSLTHVYVSTAPAPVFVVTRAVRPRILMLTISRLRVSSIWRARSSGCFLSMPLRIARK